METFLPLDEIRNLVPASTAAKQPKRLRPAEARALLEKRGFRYPVKNIVFHCLKGGAAKTTLAYNVAYRLSQLGARTLLVDLDKQANATTSFKLDKPKGVFVDVVTGKQTITDIILPAGEFLDVVPSSLDNARLEMELIGKRKNPRTYYRQLFAPIRGRYDIAVFDLPPDLSHNTYLSSIYADTICIPTNPDEYSVYGMKMTLSSLEGIQAEYEDLDQDVMVVWTKYDAREKSALHYITDLKDVGSARVMPVVVRTDTTFKHAQGQSKSVFQLPRSNAREDVDILTRELLGLGEFFGPKGRA